MSSKKSYLKPETEKMEKRDDLLKVLKALKVLNGIRNKEIAKALNVSHSYISLLLSGQKKNEKMLQKIIHFIISNNTERYFTQILLNNQEKKLGALK